MAQPNESARSVTTAPETQSGANITLEALLTAWEQVRPTAYYIASQYVPQGKMYVIDVGAEGMYFVIHTDDLEAVKNANPSVRFVDIGG